jgi:hypothetical protein
MKDVLTESFEIVVATLDEEEYDWKEGVPRGKETRFRDPSAKRTA